MADYKTQFTGPEIDIALAKAMTIPEIIGCIRLSSTVSVPYDLDGLSAPGYYAVSFYINGPTQALDFSPIVIEVTRHEAYLYQFVTIDVRVHYRSRRLDGNEWSVWQTTAIPRSVIDLSPDPDFIIINDYRIGLVDMIAMNIKLNNDINDGCQLILNNYEPIPIYTSDGLEITEGSLKNSVLTVIFNRTVDASGRFYVTSGAGTKWIKEYFARLKSSEGASLIGVKSDNLQLPMKGSTTAQEALERINAQVYTNTTDITNIINRLNTLKASEVSVESSTLPLPMKGATNVQEALIRINAEVSKIGDKISTLTANRATITDANGKLTSSAITAATMVAYTTVVVLPDSNFV